MWGTAVPLRVLHSFHKDTTNIVYNNDISHIVINKLLTKYRLYDGTESFEHTFSYSAFIVTHLFSV